MGYMNELKPTTIAPAAARIERFAQDILPQRVPLPRLIQQLGATIVHVHDTTRALIQDENIAPQRKKLFLFTSSIVFLSAVGAYAIICAQAEQHGVSLPPPTHVIGLIAPAGCVQKHNAIGTFRYTRRDASGNIIGTYEAELTQRELDALRKDPNITIPMGNNN